MKVLVTGSSGYLGSALVETLSNLLQESKYPFSHIEETKSVAATEADLLESIKRGNANAVVGIDKIARETQSLNANVTFEIGSIADREFIDHIFEKYGGFDVVLHTATLHQPHIKTNSRTDFVQTNIQGTLNLLEDACAIDDMNRTRTRCFIFTSTTSLMITNKMRDSGVAKDAFWVTEDSLGSPTPRNIYGVTKLSTEHLVRLIHEQTGLPTLILRTSRFFPEIDNDPSMHEDENISDLNRKLNEYLYRRVSRDDVVDAHLFAMERILNPERFTNLPPLKMADVFVVTARTPFKESDCAELGRFGGPAKILDKYYPEWRQVYAELGFTISNAIDRVYYSQKLEYQLGYKTKWNFIEVLSDLKVKKQQQSISGASELLEIHG